MWNRLILLNKNLVLAIPAMLTAGFLIGIGVEPQLVGELKILILPLTFLMVYPMMVTLDIRHLRKGLDFRLQATAQFINFALIPLIAFALGRLFFADRPFMALGLLLAALLPTSGMTISWTGFARGNLGAAVTMTVIGLTLGSLATPLYVAVLLGTVVEVEPIRIMQQISVIVFLPMLIGQLTRSALLKRFSPQEFKQRFAPRFPALSTVGVLGIVFVAMALKARGIMATPTLLPTIFVPLLIVYGLNYALSTCVGRLFFERGDAIALVYGTVMRNLSIALAIAINAFGEEGTHAALVIALAYIIQVQSAAWYVRLTERIFGPAASSDPERVAGV